MHIKLAFGHTSLGQFRVNAVILGGRNAPEPVVAQYAHERVFLELVSRAEITPETHAQIVKAIAAGTTAPNAAACCEDVVLSLKQLEILRLEPVLHQSA
ncbi:hypothetical protein [Granulicella sp. dw_53]|uniref:hypothetical protein n=1 Tax=Granulicella sp. dw_53 TaxID=2719792 RepID=UPI001BD4DE80|nr:hypothetical protein [Granulicella sp. dw_53]